ncbi:hypothetical protein [Metapseudomonas resinovorans]|uniref:hypothetical protein n=1 Tax=Metapseudomonas resinovorans TaxID=53412 RepID=UPI000400B3F4|nr:hypothetical protein [Pseudomonas resinovorans]
MFTRAAFGAIAGVILGLLLEPLLKALPLGPLVKAFIDSFAAELLTAGLTVAGALLSKRIRRLDHFIEGHLLWITITASALFALSLWLNAGMPVALSALCSVLLSAAAAGYLLAVSGWTIRKAMQGLTPEQQQESTDQREQEAKQITEEAIFSGEPDMAVAIFAADAGGRAGAAIAAALLLILQVAVLGILTQLAATFAAHYLYGLSWLWAILTAAVITLAGMGVLQVAASIGTAQADSVPLAEKHQPILPRDDDL